MNWTRTTWMVQRVFYDLKFSRFGLPILVVYFTTDLFPLHCCASARWDGAKSTRSTYLKLKPRYGFGPWDSEWRNPVPPQQNPLYLFSCQEPKKLLKYGNELFCFLINSILFKKFLRFHFSPNHWEMTEINFSCLCFQWAVGCSNCIGKNGYNSIIFGRRNKYLND